MDYKHKGVPRSQAETFVDGPPQPALYANTELHPTKIMQDNQLQDGERKKLAEMSTLYGSHMAMRHVVESNILG